MKNTLKVTKYILAMLKADENLKEYISADKFYPIDAKLSSTFPFAVMQRTGIVPASTKDGIFQESVDYTIIIVDDNYAGSIDIAEAVRQTLDRHSYKTDEICISRITLTGSTETYYNDSYIQQLDFKIEFNNV